MLLHITNQSRAFSPPITLIKLIQLFPKIHVQSIKETSFFRIITNMNKHTHTQSHIYMCLHKQIWNDIVQRLTCFKAIEREREKKQDKINTNCDDFIRISCAI